MVLNSLIAILCLHHCMCLITTTVHSSSQCADRNMFSTQCINEHRITRYHQLSWPLHVKPGWDRHLLLRKCLSHPQKKGEGCRDGSVKKTQSLLVVGMAVCSHDRAYKDVHKSLHSYIFFFTHDIIQAMLWDYWGTALCAVKKNRCRNGVTCV